MFVLVLAMDVMVINSVVVFTHSQRRVAVRTGIIDLRIPGS